MTVIGVRVREHRERKGLTQIALAERLGVTQGQITHIETGRVQPSLRFLYKLAEEFGVPPGELLEPAKDTLPTPA